MLIADGAIVAVGPGLAADGATTISAENMIVMPGLVDSHRHFWYTAVRGMSFGHGWKEIVDAGWVKVGATIRCEEVYVATRGGVADALNDGITSAIAGSTLPSCMKRSTRTRGARWRLPCPAPIRRRWRRPPTTSRPPARSGSRPRSTSAPATSTVFIEGEVAKRDGRLLGYDREEVAAELRESAARVFGRAGYQGKNLG